MTSFCGVRVHVLPSGPIQTNAYLLTSRKTGEAVLIDAPEGIWALAEPILKAEGVKLKSLWLTHGHWDHTQGAAEVVKKGGARVYGHPADRMLFETPEAMKSLMFPDAVILPVKVDEWLGDLDTIGAFGQKVVVRHVPGHCPGSLLFYFPGYKAAFAGDALFRANVGRTDIPGGDFEQLAESIRTRIYSLPDETVVYPGHGTSTVVGDEKVHNPHVTA